MTAEERARIVSEEYADLLMEYGGNRAILMNFENSTIHLINNDLAIVHIPVNQITNQIITKMGYKVLPTVLGLVSHSSIEASNITKLRNIPNFNLHGSGVLIGVIDTGIDYTNPIFRYADGTTRIVSIWDQTIQSETPPENMFYGTEYTREQINIALQSDNPFQIVPSKDENGHGTMVAGIAGGNPVMESNFYGIATDAEFVIVKLKPAKKFLKNFFLIPESSLAFQETDIAFGFIYMINVATKLLRPLSTGLAIGTSQGSHDGRGTLSNFLSLAASVPGVAIALAAGNEGNAQRHYYGIVNNVTGYDTVELHVGKNEHNFSMELWGTIPGIFSVSILTPSGEFMPRMIVNRDEHRELSFIFENTIIYLDFQMTESQSGDQLILFRFVNPAPGIWKISVYDKANLNTEYHIWLPIEGFISNDTYFINSNQYTTVLSNLLTPITVTAYNDIDNSLYVNASRGYTRLGNVVPHIAAPGVNVIGPTLTKSFAAYTGTSTSTAHVMGVDAMLLEWGLLKGYLPFMNSYEIQKLMERGARRNPDITYPNKDWGYGILDVFNIFESIRTVVR